VHILKQAEKAGVRNVVVTSSVASFPPSGPFGPEDFSEITLEDARTAIDNPRTIYCAAKTFADKAVLRFADSRPGMNITIVAPGSFFGPFAPGFEHILRTPDYRGLSSNAYVAALLRPNNSDFVHSPGAVDVRDVARAHINVVHTPTSGRRRWPLLSPHQSSWREAINFIAEERPELKGRLCGDVRIPVFTSHSLPIDHEKLGQVFDMPVDSYLPWKATVLDAVDDIIALETIWTSKGLVISMPDDASHVLAAAGGNL